MTTSDPEKCNHQTNGSFSAFTDGSLLPVAGAVNALPSYLPKPTDQ